MILQKTYQSPSKEHHAMTANHSIDPAQFLSENLERVFEPMGECSQSAWSVQSRIFLYLRHTGHRTARRLCSSRS